MNTDGRLEGSMKDLEKELMIMINMLRRDVEMAVMNLLASWSLRCGQREEFPNW